MHCKTVCIHFKRTTNGSLQDKKKSKCSYIRFIPHPPPCDDLATPYSPTVNDAIPYEWSDISHEPLWFGNPYPLRWLYNLWTDLDSYKTRYKKNKLYKLTSVLAMLADNYMDCDYDGKKHWGRTIITYCEQNIKCQNTN